MDPIEYIKNPANYLPGDLINTIKHISGTYQNPVSPVSEDITIKHDTDPLVQKGINAKMLYQAAIDKINTANQRNRGVQKQQAAQLPQPTQKVLGVADTNTPFNDKIRETAKKYGLPYGVLKAQLSRESAGFQPQYVGGYHTDKTGRGIAGIDKVYNPQITDEQAFDPNFAIDWAGQQMKNLQQAEGGSLYNALRRYNGGPSYASSRAGFQGVPVSQRTKDYADKVMDQAKGFGD